MNKILTGSVALAAVLAVPGFAFAADYAYVNQAGEVNMITASNPTEAMTIAPNIHVNSGVLLLDSSADTAIVGDEIN